MDKESCGWPLWLGSFFEQVQQISRKVSLDQESNINQPPRDLIPWLLVFSVDHKNDPGAGADYGHVRRESQSGRQRLASVHHNDFISRLANFIKSGFQAVRYLSLSVAG